MFSPLKQKEKDEYLIFVFNMRYTDMESLIKYCSKDHPEIKDWKDDYDAFTADKAVKDTMERQERLHPQETH
jgi:hypothetical protein